MPKLRGTASLDWQRGRHAATLQVHTIDSYTDDTAQSAFLAAYIGTAETIRSMTTADLQYRLELPALIQRLATNQLTLGIKNLFNKSPPWVNVDGAYDYYTHDPRGRMLYLRYRLSI